MFRIHRLSQKKVLILFCSSPAIVHDPLQQTLNLRFQKSFSILKPKTFLSLKRPGFIQRYFYLLLFNIVFYSMLECKRNTFETVSE